MKVINYFIMLSVILLPMSCNASDRAANDGDMAKQLISYFFAGKAKVIEDGKPYFKTGDFNGDAVQDIAVLFVPSAKPAESKQLKVTMPWVYPGTVPGNEYRKSLVIFHKGKGKWLADDTRAYVLLDTSGVLETPSFELLVSANSASDYKSHSMVLPLATSNDLIILPTEAGIDT